MKFRRLKSLSPILAVVFFTLWFITNYVLMGFEQPMLAKVGYGFFALFSAASYLVKNQLFKKSSAVFSLFCVLFVGCNFPLDIEVIEEIYLFIPLLYILAFPGSLYPILASVLLLSAYIPSLDEALLADIIEDGAELVIITSFASIMTYFQQKSRKQMETFRKESYTDYLTGLANRKCFLETLERCVATCKRDEKKQFALLIVDLDGFKQVNDRYGHVVGDSALRRYA
ncbi:GGDEF domain-containing protein [Pseudoalteromonas sp. G4]|uniref:GGDEF domain-containing protein n=1 Tax=Pseudoalteromonas sp. G4 TaxID=2992761 RepID=UPI00237DF42A|nr:GGDEF domain-containing protein [Pseudoalteromonas sp. G4]MDE3272852.1 GGDEF domain-containing protein [Pseudoalteromonas sp. G4]